jgi:hypothetical protein
MGNDDSTSTAHEKASARTEPRCVPWISPELVRLEIKGVTAGGTGMMGDGKDSTRA